MKVAENLQHRTNHHERVMSLHIFALASPANRQIGYMDRPTTILGQTSVDIFKVLASKTQRNSSMHKSVVF